MIHPALGLVVLVLDDTTIEPETDGMDGSSVFPVTISLLSFMPRPNEIIEGTLREVTDFGAVLQIGPIDALLHKAHVRGFLEYDDVEFDMKIQAIKSTHSNRVCRAGAKVRARIISVSKKDAGGQRLFVTCTEPTLGFDWFAASYLF